MHLKNKFNIFIFDCDGVVLDSNNLKIEAMKDALTRAKIDSSKISDCIGFFKKNFGKSRHHHINFFLDEILLVKKNIRNEIFNKLLFDYSENCRHLYAKSKTTPGFINFVKTLNGKKFIASGSDQKELRKVMIENGLDEYFDRVYGSPDSKTNIIKKIINNNNGTPVMFGDSIADIESAEANSIEFIGYLPFSNVKKELISIAKKKNYTLLESWC